MPTPTWENPPGPPTTLTHISTTTHGDGISETLQALTRASPSAWATITADSEFHTFTGYLHQLLHGSADPMTDDWLTRATPHYRATLAPYAHWLTTQLAPGDTVVLHGIQTLGLAPVLSAAGLRTAWHCHAGTTEEDASGPAAVWRMFHDDLASVDLVLSTLPEYAPKTVPMARRRVISPAVDPHSLRNRPLSTDEQDTLLAELGLTLDQGLVEQDRPLPAEAPMVLQLARWQRLKDMRGVLRAFPALPPHAHLVLAGNDPDELPDDPDGWSVYEEVRELRAQLPVDIRRRVHLALLSTQDPVRSALTVNALQRRADVVLQKSFAEGFGLAVTEAMLKGRAVVAADVGGLRQQISPGHSGLLVDPHDVNALASAVGTLLDDPLLRRRLGRGAAESVTRRYLMPRLVADYGRLTPSRSSREVA